MDEQAIDQMIRDGIERWHSPSVIPIVHSRPLTDQERHALFHEIKRMFSTTRAQLAAITRERDDALDDLQRTTDRLNRALDDVRCPDCGCADEVDAQSNECGCDSPLCGRDGSETFTAWALRLLRERDEARAIVERLPKTADGVVVPPGTVVWELRPHTNRVIRLTITGYSKNDEGEWTVMFTSGFSAIWDWNRVYSTEELAQAAAKEVPRG